MNHVIGSWNILNHLDSWGGRGVQNKFLELSIRVSLTDCLAKYINVFLKGLKRSNTHSTYHTSIQHVCACAACSVQSKRHITARLVFLELSSSERATGPGGTQAVGESGRARHAGVRSPRPTAADSER